MKNPFDHSPADTFLLAAFGVGHWPGRSGGCRVLDLGCAAGRLLYEVAHCRPEAELFGLEVQPALLWQAEQALVRRGLRIRRLPRFDTAMRDTGVVQIVLGDVRFADACSPASSFDIVFLNPPYFGRGEGRVPPDPARAGYRHEGAATLEDFLQGTEYFLSPGGIAFFIYPWRRMRRFESALAATKLRLAVRQEVFPGTGATQPYWTLGRLVPLERCRETEVLEPIRHPDALTGLIDEQATVFTA